MLIKNESAVLFTLRPHSHDTGSVWKRNEILPSECHVNAYNRKNSLRLCKMKLTNLKKLLLDIFVICAAYCQSGI
jgi:hypothetical protein